MTRCALSRCLKATVLSSQVKVASPQSTMVAHSCNASLSASNQPLHRVSWNLGAVTLTIFEWYSQWGSIWRSIMVYIEYHCVPWRYNSPRIGELDGRSLRWWWWWYCSKCRREVESRNVLTRVVIEPSKALTSDSNSCRPIAGSWSSGNSLQESVFLVRGLG